MMTEQSLNDQGSVGERERVLEAVLSPASEAYYSERVRSGSGARLRAQAAQSTVTLFAGGVVAALTFTQLADRPLITRWAGLVAVGLWLSAAVLYLWAVALPVTSLAGPSHARDRLDLLNAVLKRADDEAAEVDTRQKRANRVVVGALVVSLLTVGLAALLGPEKETAPGTVVFAPSYAKNTRPMCGKQVEQVQGEIDKKSIGTPFVRVTVDAKVCGFGTGKTELVVPRSAVQVIAIKGD
ncbi:hypothetical protein [Streptomyces tendae]|uniref:hypothetical protein n=1 Tax=Streptomyces tendae TaxID=1932 RepID=UPI00132FB915|nr:hypothetical protein [Streptomyces tendae]